MLNQRKLVELERIREADGGLLFPESVVKKAADPSNALHEEFEWRDDVAAHQHRLHQARVLIRSVVIERIEEEKVISSVYYIHHPALGTHEPGYAPVSQIKRNRQHALDALAFELSRVEGSLVRAREIAQALGLSSHFEQMLRQLTVIKSKIKAA
jgi:hypothetical protein